MWPWEHAAFGYVLYSMWRHTRHRTAPGNAEAWAVVLAAVAPDLVDKPLSWGLGVFPTGYAVAHSVFVGGLGAVVVALLARRYGRPHVGWAVVIGYGSHLVGDVVYPAVTGGGFAPARVLWPLVSLPPYETQLGLVMRTLLYLRRTLGQVLAGEVVVLVVAYLTLFSLVGVLWLYDGAPGVAPLVRTLGIGRDR